MKRNSALNITVYRDKNIPDRNGIECDFIIKPKPKGPFTVVQNISVQMRVINEHGHRDSEVYTYSELWYYDKKKRSRKQTDTFAISVKGWRDGYDGTYEVKATAYLVKGKLTVYKRGKLSDGLATRCPVHTIKTKMPNNAVIERRTTQRRTFCFAVK